MISTRNPMSSAALDLGLGADLRDETEEMKRKRLFGKMQPEGGGRGLLGGALDALFGGMKLPQQGGAVSNLFSRGF